MSNKPLVHLIGNAHIDPVWLWRWQEGYAEIKATYQSALDRLKEFPDFVFTTACAAYYQWVEENAPEMFEEIQMRVAEGRWVIVGGWWIQPDCNLPSGETFARHGLYSQRYFLEKFGTCAKVGYNVDSFGHNGMLPQILKKSGMDYYLFMRPEKHEKDLQSNLFWWESPDGSRVLTFRLSHGYGNWGAANLRGKLDKVLTMATGDEFPHMAFYGVGNHGGGPTIANIRELQSVQSEFPGVFTFSSPNAYFEEVEGSDLNLPVLKEDLQLHAIGCYSTHSESKATQRRVEHRLMTAEKFAVLAEKLFGLPCPTDRLEHAWKNVLFNSFHDIMGGCSIKEAFDDVRESYGEALNIAAVTLNAALQKISWSIDTMVPGVESLSKEKDWHLWEQDDFGVPIVVFNPLGWDVQAPVKVTKLVTSITDDERRPVPMQKVRASRSNGEDKWDTQFIASIPAFGYRVYWLYKTKPSAVEVLEAAEGALSTESGQVLENHFVRIEFNAHTGWIQNLVDKQSGKSVFDGAGAVPIVIDESHSDTWGHGLRSYRNEIARFTDADFQVIEQGPVSITVRVTSRYNASKLQQDFTLYQDLPGVFVKVRVDWREQHKMLKLSFPVQVSSPRAVYEIPYGSLERPVDGEEKPGQQWVDISGTTENGATFGLALMNDAKYAYDALNNELRLTVVRSPLYADHYAGKHRDNLAEFMEQGIHEFQYKLLPHEGSWQDAHVVRHSYELNVPPIAIIETYHRGSLPQAYQGIQISGESVVATVLKAAEDGDGYILRCYESAGREVDATIELASLNRRFEAKFSPNEIKTFLIPHDSSRSVMETNLIEQI